MQDGFSYLIDTLFILFLFALIVRMWLQLADADYFSPLAVMIRKITNPFVKPFQIIPTIKHIRLDLGLLVLMILVMAIRLVFKFHITDLSLQSIQILLYASCIWLIREALSLIFWFVIIRAILSWFSNGRQPLELILYELTEPLLRPIRRIIPPMGGLDFSVLVLILIIGFLQRII